MIDQPTLRDWLAMNASEIDIAIYREYDTSDPTAPTHKYTRDQARYRFADAMIEARNEQL